MLLARSVLLSLRFFHFLRIGNDLSDLFEKRSDTPKTFPEKFFSEVCDCGVFANISKVSLA